MQVKNYKWENSGMASKTARERPGYFKVDVRLGSLAFIVLLQTMAKTSYIRLKNKDKNL